MMNQLNINKMKNICYFLICILLLYSCGNGKKKAAEKQQAYYDSIAKVMKLQEIEKNRVKDSLAVFAWGDAKFGISMSEALKTDAFKGFEHVFVGHFHTQQKKKNITYIGSPHQLNRNDENKEKGFVVLDTDTKDFEFHIFNNYPKFLTISSSDLKRINEIDFKNKLVYINIDKKISDISKLRYVLFEKGAVSITPVFSSEEKNIEFDNHIEYDGNIQKIAIEYINNLNLEEMKGFDLEGVKKNLLLKMFDKIVEETK